VTDQPAKEEVLETIRRNIEQSGFHAYAVTGGGVPQFAYTVGLTQSIGAELLLAGAHFYVLDQIKQIIAFLARESRSLAMQRGQEISTEYGSFLLRDADLSWIKALMLELLTTIKYQKLRLSKSFPTQPTRRSMSPI
jgi:hypothetical protein